MLIFEEKNGHIAKLLEIVLIIIEWFIDTGKKKFFLIVFMTVSVELKFKKKKIEKRLPEKC